MAFSALNDLVQLTKEPVTVSHCRRKKMEWAGRCSDVLLAPPSEIYALQWQLGSVSHPVSLASFFSSVSVLKCLLSPLSIQHFLVLFSSFLTSLSDVTCVVLSSVATNQVPHSSGVTAATEKCTLPLVPCVPLTATFPLYHWRAHQIGTGPSHSLLDKWKLAVCEQDLWHELRLVRAQMKWGSALLSSFGWFSRYHWASTWGGPWQIHYITWH